MKMEKRDKNLCSAEDGATESMLVKIMVMLNRIQHLFQDGVTKSMLLYVILVLDTGIYFL